jgi:3-oxoacyl-[acyl-carrier-protein] synthase-3
VLVRDIASALPGWRVPSDVVAGWTGLDEGFITTKLGIAERAYLAENETVTSLAASACRTLFERNPELDPAAIGLLVVVTQNPDFRLPHTAALLQQELGLDTGLASFDVGLGCSGWVYALSIARGFMAAEGVDDALVVTCDPYSRIMGRADRETAGLFGDAAAATWLSSERGAAIGRADHGTDGSGAERLIVRAGGSAAPLGGLAANGSGPRLPDDPADLRLTMHGRSIFNFMMGRVPQSIDACLARNGLAADDIDLYVFHQASAYMLEQLSRRLGLSEDRAPRLLEQTGNTVSSSIPLALEALAADGRLDGRRVLVSGFGVGLSWATNVLHFPNGGER